MKLSVRDGQYQKKDPQNINPVPIPCFHCSCLSSSYFKILALISGRLETRSSLWGDHSKMHHSSAFQAALEASDFPACSLKKTPWKLHNPLVLCQASFLPQETCCGLRYNNNLASLGQISQRIYQAESDRGRWAETSTPTQYAAWRLCFGCSLFGPLDWTSPPGMLLKALQRPGCWCRPSHPH